MVVLVVVALSVAPSIHTIDLWYTFRTPGNAKMRRSCGLLFLGCEFISDRKNPRAI